MKLKGNEQRLQYKMESPAFNTKYAAVSVWFNVQHVARTNMYLINVIFAW